MKTPIRVFVCYSHKDAQHLDTLSRKLRGLEDYGITFWDDRDIVGGANWDKVIKSRLRDCDIALCLISENFLNSRYIHDEEIRTILATNKYLFPLLLSHCNWTEYKWLRSRQIYPQGQDTFLSISSDDSRSTKLYMTLALQLQDIAEEIRSSGHKFHVITDFAPINEIGCALINEANATNRIDICTLRCRWLGYENSRKKLSPAQRELKRRLESLASNATAAAPPLNARILLLDNPATFEPGVLRHVTLFLRAGADVRYVRDARYLPRVIILRNKFLLAFSTSGRDAIANVGLYCEMASGHDSLIEYFRQVYEAAFSRGEVADLAGFPR